MRTLAITRFWLVMAGVLFIVRAASAQPASVPEGPADPVLTEEALPTEVGEWEVRLTGDFSVDRVFAPRMQTFFGIVTRLGGEVATTFGDGDGSYGASSVGASVKWLALENRPSAPALIVGAEVEATTLSGRNPVEIVPFVSLLKVFKRMAVQGRVGPIWRVREGDESDEDEPSLAFDVALLVPVGSRLHLVGEAGRGEDKGYMAPGLRYQLTERVSLASAVPFHIDDRQARFVIQMQATF